MLPLCEVQRVTPGRGAQLDDGPPIGLCTLEHARPGCRPLTFTGATHEAQGFDEYMNLVLEDAEEVSMKKKTRKALGPLPCPLARFTPLGAGCLGCLSGIGRCF